MASNGFQAILMALLVSVSLGYIFIWIMIPTNTYRVTWLSKIKSATKSTYFGTQGPSMLMYTFPVLFVAVFGCIYLHLKNKNNGAGYKSPKGEKKGMIAWKRPIIIKGLGIVSLIELTFFTMFIALLVWYFSVSLTKSFSKITAESAAEDGEALWEAKLDSSALRLGLVGELCLAFLFFPVARGSSVLQLFGLTSEASIKYHIWVGHICMALFTAHGLGYIIIWSATHELKAMLEWSKTGVSIIAGEISLLSGLIMWATTIPRIRRKVFELFFYAHHLYIVFMLFYLFHVGLNHFCYTLPGFFLFMIDRFLRFLQSRQNVRLVSARILPCQAVELNFSKTPGLTYTPTSIIFLNVPSISKMQWHPFTISSSSNLEADKLSVVIKGEGSWTKKLHNILSSPDSPIENLAVSVEGPYGPTTTNFLRHESLVMVSGGSGITPFISIIRELIYASETLGCKTPSILLVSAFKNSSDLAMLDLILPMISSSSSQMSKLNIQVEAYVTREKQPPSEGNNNNISTIWFKPRPSDSPIAPILGKNNWLWLGAIISSSFIIYLIFIGILTRYYIYPIEQSPDGVVPSATKCFLTALFLCVPIIIVATAAFLYNKNQNAMEGRQIMSMEGATPAASPNNQWFYNADRELESLPQQSLSLSTNVHFGERPNLKRLLFDCEESSVGVLVCGPKKLRHDVANICSSGLSSNLHFESISFSW